MLSTIAIGGGGGGAGVSVEELRRRGQTESEAQRNVVEATANELAMERFRAQFGIILACSLCCIVLPLFVSILGVAIWAAVSLDKVRSVLTQLLWGFFFGTSECAFAAMLSKRSPDPLRDRAARQDKGLPCDKPIREYVWGFIILLCYNSWCNQCVIRNVLDYDPERDGAQSPTRVKIYNTCFFVANVVWNICGLVWITTSETCSTTSPSLYESAKATTT